MSNLPMPPNGRLIGFAVLSILICLCPYASISSEGATGNVEQPYVIPQRVEELARELQAFSGYGFRDTSDVSSYLDLLSAVSVMAQARAAAQHRSVTDDDYRLMFYATCLPGDPPKARRIVDQAHETRAWLFGGAYMSAAKRQDIVRRMKALLLLDDRTTIAQKLTNPLTDYSTIIDTSKP